MIANQRRLHKITSVGVIIPAPVLPTSPGDQRGGSMCKTLKTDIKLFAAAIVSAATVLGANVSLADVVAMLGGAN
ncbi:hypothetical protein LB561_29990 [Mesorhizobium sp. B292B1B]|uniref:hypothetical protein n=1 Tax=unclassified Mesorhizobium TaxID=325217 RepID=UPI0015E3A46C|nr:MULTISPECIES: hypothetical protein [unclassified Mesorhizobium]MCA0015454.1 hypothetical protein [Mesorhizobium sp. B294B1A1]MCA0041480.1 hypothetical protein [Mesorhizobium sp. B292B1B]